MRAAALTALLLLSCSESPAEPREEFTLETAFGGLRVFGPLSAAPALDEGARLAFERATRELPERAQEFSGVLGGWTATLRGNGSSISVSARRMSICATSALCTTHGFFHELGTAAAAELGSCPHLSQIWECEPFGGGYTLACERC